MTEEECRRLPRTERQRRHHEVDDERHAHPGEPRRLQSGEHDTSPREPVPRFAPIRVREERGVARDRY
jgi:hypothetical protein